MRILFTLCGRAGSKGIKNKNICTFLNYPLPYHTLAAIQMYCEQHKEHQCDIALNTDSKELIEIVCRYKNEISIVERKEKLAGDVVSKIQVIRDTMEQMEEKKRYQYDLVVDVDLTSPLRQGVDLEHLVDKYMQSEFDVVFSVTNARRNPYFNMVKINQGYCERVIASQFSARQQAPEIYDMNASMYAYSPAFLRMDKEIFDGKCGMIEMYDTAVLDLDHTNDLMMMEVIGKYLVEHVEGFKEVYENIPNIIKER